MANASSRRASPHSPDGSVAVVNTQVGRHARLQRRWAVLVPILGALVPLTAMLMASRPWQRDLPGDVLGSLIGLIAFGLLPYAIVVVILLTARRVHWLWWSALIYAVVIAVVGAVMALTIITDDSSTAALGFVVAPILQLIGLPVALVIGAVIGLVGRKR